MWMQPEVFAGLYNSTDTHGLSDMAAIVTLGNGFIITAMIWVTALVAMIDGQMRRAVLALLVGAVPVSYTHLDVYKRQIQRRRGKTGHANSWAGTCGAGKGG